MHKQFDGSVLLDKKISISDKLKKKKGDGKLTKELRILFTQINHKKPFFYNFTIKRKKQESIKNI